MFHISSFLTLLTDPVNQLIREIGEDMRQTQPTQQGPQGAGTMTAVEKLEVFPTSDRALIIKVLGEEECYEEMMQRILNLPMNSGWLTNAYHLMISDETLREWDYPRSW